jgi:hypothetical protein
LRRRRTGNNLTRFLVHITTTVRLPANPKKPLRFVSVQGDLNGANLLSDQPIKYISVQAASVSLSVN